MTVKRPPPVVPLFPMPGNAAVAPTGAPPLVVRSAPPTAPAEPQPHSPRRAAAAVGDTTFTAAPTTTKASRRFAGTPVGARKTGSTTRADDVALALALRTAPAGSSATATEELGGFARFWRDFGINPKAMLARAFVDPVPKDGAPIQGATKAEPLGMEPLRQELHGVVERLRQAETRGLTDEGLADFKRDLRDVFATKGVEIDFREGAPTVAWGALPRLEVMDRGGAAAAHELVHVVQCAIGGAAALATAAAEKIRREQGRAPSSESELLAAVRTLSDEERASAFAQVVSPMERQAYALFEEAAFDATGMFGKGARDIERYTRELHENVDAFCDAYLNATAPAMHEGRDAKFYGSIAHIARTHGETALLLGATGVLYQQAASLALALKPVVGAAALLPLVYLSWRSLHG